MSMDHVTQSYKYQNEKRDNVMCVSWKRVVIKTYLDHLLLAPYVVCQEADSLKIYP